MDRTIVGRDGVLETAWRALGDGRPVLLEGPAGIGKTAVWRSLLDRARSDGWRVLSCAPAESETGLPLAALADVLEPVADAVADLPAPQRTAAEVALLSSPGEVDERALGAAVRTLLDGQPGRVLVAVDDAPWLAHRRARRKRQARETLTATEDRVATLAAKGLTNKAIADQLFISPKTVEANLARVYRKLGIASRTELGALIGRETPDSSEGART